MTSEGLKPGKSFNAKGKNDDKKWLVQNLLMKKVKVDKPNADTKKVAKKKTILKYKGILNIS